jgi:hypothetical protein
MITDRDMPHVLMAGWLPDVHTMDMAKVLSDTNKDWCPPSMIRMSGADGTFIYYLESYENYIMTYKRGEKIEWRENT